MPTQEERTSDVQAANQASVTAEVRKPGDRMIRLWHSNEVWADFPEEKVAAAQGMGWSRFPPDPERLCTEYEQACDAAKRAARALVEGVVADGHIDPDDQAQLAALNAAQRDLWLVGQFLTDSLGAAWPIRETGETVLMTEHRWEVGDDDKPTLVQVKGPDGEPSVHRVQKDQVEEYRRVRGWKVKRDGRDGG